MDESEKKVKFLCSHGGRIAPRPADGHLKYVGGETRVVAVSRHITFSELKKRLSEVSEGEMEIKYQLFPEDIDTLVSVKNDEDVLHMLHEYDRISHEDASSPKLRTFLFSARRPNAKGMAPVVTTFSASSSPNSNSPETAQLVSPYATTSTSSYSNMMQRVQSSPSLYRPNSPHQHLCRSTERLGRPLSFGRSELRPPFVHGLEIYSRQQYQRGSASGYNNSDDQLMSPCTNRAESVTPRSPRKRLWD